MLFGGFEVAESSNKLTTAEIETAVKYVSTAARRPREEDKRAYRNGEDIILSSKELNAILIKEWLSTKVSITKTLYCYFTTMQCEHAIVV